jgi:RNA polymerase sigma factor (sigma-70 family)
VNQLLRYLRAASPQPASIEVPDRELLARFGRKRDADAFALLVSRHGAAVWAACRRLLDRDEDAEDAFQAVFLTLARKASSATGDCLAAWLHAVARRIASNMRREHRRRTATEDAARTPEGRTTDMNWREGPAILDEELARLPDRCRAALIACCLDGRTRDEAARQMGCSEGQVKGLLERGRELLRQRLSRRGFDLGALIFAATVANSASATPAVPVEFAVRIAQGQSAAGVVSSAAAAHSERVVNAMFMLKVKAFAAVLLGAAIAVGGAYTQGAAGGSEPTPGKRGDRKPGHAFAPRGGTAVADDPLKGPSKPVPPTKPGTNPFVPAPGTPDAPGTKDTEKPLQKVFTESTLDPKMLRIPGNRFAVEVTGRTDGECWGTDLYFYKSALGTAAVHAGLLKVGEKAVITVTVVKCPKNGEESRQNGVTSLPWDDAATTDTALLLQRLPAKPPPAAKAPDALTIDQAILAKREKVTVKFEVGNSRYTWHTGFGAKEARVITFYPKDKLKGGDTFQVLVADKAATHLFNLGLMDEQPAGNSYLRGASVYFQGKTIRATGKVEPIEDRDKKGIDYRLVISDLENLEVVK